MSICRFKFFFLCFISFYPLLLQGVNTKDLVLKAGSPGLGRIKTLTSQKFHFKKTIQRFVPKNILFLGDDAPKKSNFFSLAQRHHKFFLTSSIEVYQTDLNCPNEDQEDTGVKKRTVNHRKTFPFQDNTFNIIIGSRLLCTCPGIKPTETCGGLSSTDDSYLYFFSEIIRVLRKKKNSFAYIDGRDFHPSFYNNKKTNTAINTAKETLAALHPKLKFFRVVYTLEGGQKVRLGVILGNAEVWESGYWSTKCTACPAKLYEKKHCRENYSVINEKGCKRGGCRGFCKRNPLRE